MRTMFLILLAVIGIGSVIADIFDDKNDWGDK